MSDQVENPRWFVKVIRRRRLESFTNNDLKRYRREILPSGKGNSLTFEIGTIRYISGISDLVYSVDEEGTHTDYRIAKQKEISAQGQTDEPLVAKYFAHPHHHGGLISTLVHFARNRSL